MRQYGLFRSFDRVLPCGLACGQVIEKSGERGRNRTSNLLIKSQLLCQLSYAPKPLFSVNYGRCHFVKSGIVVVIVS